MNTSLKKILSVFCLFSFSGCAVFSPFVQDFNIVSVAQENQIGAQTAQQVAQQMTILPDAAPNQRVRSIGQKLVQALPHKDFNYEFFVVKDGSPNAFTIPGGKIYVHTGLLGLADDAELAGVMAHEIGHAYERHPAKSISRQYGVETLSSLLFSGKNKAAQSQLKQVALQIAKTSIVTHYGREDEYQADEAGFYILKRSGLPTAGLVRFFQKLQTLQGKGASIPFLSTHPPTPDRIARLQALESGKIVPNIDRALVQAG